MAQISWPPGWPYSAGGTGALLVLLVALGGLVFFWLWTRQRRRCPTTPPKNRSQSVTKPYDGPPPI